VLERWLQPQLFGDHTPKEVETELELQSHLNTHCQTPDDYLRRMTHHLNTWISERDFDEMRSYGINSVRVPVDYRMFVNEEDEPANENIRRQRNSIKELKLSLLDRVFDWSRHRNMEVIIDIHTGKGSQNGDGHSGEKGRGVTWPLRWSNVQLSLDAIRNVCLRYKDRDNFFGIELLNEPRLEPGSQLLEHFVNESYKIVRSISKSIVVIFHDGFSPDSWEHVLASLNHFNVLIDVHEYFCFDNPPPRVSTIEANRDSFLMRRISK